MRGLRGVVMMPVFVTVAVVMAAVVVAMYYSRGAVVVRVGLGLRRDRV